MIKSIVFVTCAMISNHLLAFQLEDSNEMTRLSSYSSLEPAFPKGSLGFRFGIGFDKYSLPDPGDSIAEKSDIDLANIYLHKGTPWPIDIGILVSQGVNSNLQRFGGHLQWNFYQGFRRPSLSARLAHVSSEESHIFKATSTQVSLAADYSIFSYITLFAKLGIEIHRFQSIRTGYYTLTTETVESSLTRPVQEFGVQIRVVPGYLDITLATQRTIEGEEHIVSKLGLGI